MAKHDNRWCLICQPRNRTLYWHVNDEEQMAAQEAKGYKPSRLWCYCNKCDRPYTIEQYCDIAGIDMTEFLSGDFHVQEAKPDEVTAMAWPHSFIPLSDPRAAKGVEYIKSRGLSVDGDMYYDLNEEGIVFPYYADTHFCGAQVRFIKERINEDGSKWKITTLPGTRLGLLFGMWNQSKLMAQVKGIVICEGYFNAVALQQAFNLKYGGFSRNPWKFICTSGSGVTDHQAETLKDLKDKGYKIVGAFDTDEAGFKGIRKLYEKGCLTHFSVTGDTASDWNDFLKNNDLAKLAELLLKNIQKIETLD